MGQQGGTHDEVAVVTPFEPGAEVIAAVIKASQGNNPVDGTAWIYHDEHDGAGTQLGHIIAGPCSLVGGIPDDFASVCEATSSGEPLGVWDGLSLFVNTTGGSFTGATACVLIDPVNGFIGGN